MGITNIKIIKGMAKTTRQCWRQPTAAEIKFGHGAIHYRDFTLQGIGTNRQGKMKKWFIAPDDKLRYHTN